MPANPDVTRLCGHAPEHTRNKIGQNAFQRHFLHPSPKTQKEKVLENQGLFTGGSDLTRTDDTPGMDEIHVLKLHQSMSAFVYRAIILPHLGARKFIPTRFTVQETLLIPALAASSLLPRCLICSTICRPKRSASPKP